MMKTLDPKELPIPKLHQYLLGSIGPRPICFASTVDADGNRNLSPFSFFNVFSANPPIMVFSPARSGRTGQHKNTYENCRDTGEVVINVVNYDIVHQMSLASSPYAKGVDEFIKAGFTPIESDLITPARVKESPIQFECKVNEIKELGQNGGAGNLIICEVLRMHFKEDVLDEDGFVDQQKIDLVSRMGRNWYCRAAESSMFEIPKPITSIGIGIDQLPSYIKHSSLLTGNHLGQLAGVEELPSADQVANAPSSGEAELLEKVEALLQSNKIVEALALLMKNLS